MPSIEISHGCAKGERPLIPQVCKIDKITEETPDVKSFRVVTLDGKKPFECEPGQLGMLGLFEYGESMFVVAAQSPDWVEFTVKKVGFVTEQLHSLQEGDEVSLRGPYGNWWPMESCKGKDMLFIGGGIGLPPVRSFLLHCLENRDDFGRIDLVYSGSTYSDLVFKEQLFNVWPNEPDMHVHVSVYHESDDLPKDKGIEISYTAPYLETLDLGPEDGNRVAVVCGGPSLSRTCRESLVKSGFDEGHIITTLEMRMKCGVGKCGRCNIGGHFICLDGPIFTLEEIGKMHSDV
ncbi:MAG: FAD/NAD(P)-binding protein [Coriobacteriales bacterium]|jgi:NAD(P)H-flavin reductase